MSEYQNRQRKQIKLSRLEIAAELYKRGYSLRKIRDEVMKRLELGSYSLRTVYMDIQSLLKEWRENRLNDTDQAIQLELERIDDAVRELWAQWEKSKQDYTKTSSKRKGAPIVDKKTTQQHSCVVYLPHFSSSIIPVFISKHTKENRFIIQIFFMIYSAKVMD